MTSMTNQRVITEVKSLYLTELGITNSNEIDLEAIAFYKHVTVKRKSLKGCEARIIGVNDKAIITVNSDSLPERQRFSIGHELGHWFKDKGKVSCLCSKADVDASGNSKLPHKEVIANEFASELLVPNYLLKSLIQHLPLNMETVTYISSLFKVSMMVSLLKVIEVGDKVGFAAIYDKNQSRRRFKNSIDLPYDFFPPRQAPYGSLIHTLIEKKLSSPLSDTVNGEIWCKKHYADGAVVHEEAFHYFEDQFITLIWWEDEEPIISSIDDEPIND